MPFPVEQEWSKWFDAMAHATQNALKTLPAEHVLALHLNAQRDASKRLEVLARVAAAPISSDASHSTTSFQTVQPPAMESIEPKLRGWQRLPSSELRTVFKPKP